MELIPPFIQIFPGGGDHRSGDGDGGVAGKGPRDSTPKLDNMPGGRVPWGGGELDNMPGEEFRGGGEEGGGGIPGKETGYGYWIFDV